MVAARLWQNSSWLLVPILMACSLVLVTCCYKILPSTYHMVLITGICVQGTDADELQLRADDVQWLQRQRTDHGVSG